MIKEICQFMEELDPLIKEMIPKIKNGVHILLAVEDDKVFVKDYAFTSDADNGKGKFLKECAQFAHTAWMIDTNKCFDLPKKAIHSCSPYCLGLKKSSLNDETFGRVDDYFKKAILMFSNLILPIDKIKRFQDAICTQTKVANLLIPEGRDLSKLKDTDYIVIYLDVPFEKIEEYSRCYRRDRLFNTADYNQEIADEMWGSSNFLNGFPTKKPYLLHQTASFNISGRISEKEALRLDEFQSLMNANLLPRPLPLFIYSEERQVEMKIFSESLRQGERIGYKKLIEDIVHRKNEVGNYYLIYFNEGTVKDFEFVSQFKYSLDSEPWIIKDYFKVNSNRENVPLQNVFDFETTVLPVLFENTLVVKTKDSGYRYKYFEEIDGKYAPSEQILSLVLKYRKAFYEYIYKSKRGSVTRQMLEDILYTGISDDIRCDEKKEKRYNICQKLNIWFNLIEKFDKNQNNKDTMGNNLLKHRAFMDEVREGRLSIETDDQYVFAVGQILHYLFAKSKSADTSYKGLESFLRQTQVAKLNLAVASLFEHYKHENYSRYFRQVFAQIMDYTSDVNLKNMMPVLLAGFFSDNRIYPERKEMSETSIIELQTEEN